SSGRASTRCRERHPAVSRSPAPVFSDGYTPPETVSNEKRVGPCHTMRRGVHFEPSFPAPALTTATFCQGVSYAPRGALAVLAAVMLWFVAPARGEEPPPG